MNAMYQQSQTSGNNWDDAYFPHQVQRRAKQTVPQPFTQEAVFSALEEQMQGFSKLQDEIAEIKKSFVLVGGKSIETFLSEHRGVSQVLLESVTQLRRFFGLDPVLSLRAPLDESGSQTMYAVVMWSKDLADVRRRMDDFDASWWLAKSRQTSGYLNFTYELI